MRLELAHLPPELVEALQAERSVYRGVGLREVTEVREEADGILSLLPSPAADSSWNGGQLFGFDDAETPAFAGEILHVDASTGRVFASPGTTAIDPPALVAPRWRYKPFDFSTAILNAAAAAGAMAERLSVGLREVYGAQGAVTVERSPEEVWDLPWGILWGPPGTGKTETVSRLLAEEIAKHPGRKILAVAPTNRAADTVALRVARLLASRGALFGPQGPRVFRGGRSPGHELSKTYPQLLQDSEFQQRVASIAADEERLRLMKARNERGERIAALARDIANRQKGLGDETLFASREGAATLVVVTVHRALNLVSQLAPEMRFARVVLDEAGMVSRAACSFLALLAGRMFLAGDPRQIGPISRAQEGADAHVRRWLRGSPLSHLDDAAKRPNNVALLRAQYRMHPEICRVVSDFAYGGQLTDSPEVARRASNRGFGFSPRYSGTRANWVVLDHHIRDLRKTSHRRPERGSGYVRDLSADYAIELARDAVASRMSVLVLTPYRAQAQSISERAAATGLMPPHFTASTIHRQQGTEADVVIVDTVAALRPFPASDASTLLNVAASRARSYLFVLATKREAEAPTLGALIKKLAPISYSPGAMVPPANPAALNAVATRPFQNPLCFGDELQAGRSNPLLYTHEQVTLFERKVSEGHHLVRGVAGSGKTYVLAKWAERFVSEHPGSRILVSFFNTGLEPLFHGLLRVTAQQHLGQVEICTAASAVKRFGPNTFDAVFIDEAQDLTRAELATLYATTKPLAADPSKRPFFLFLDDSQDLYGRRPLDHIHTSIPGLSFQGKSRVLRESFRSTRQSLDLAFNVVLDPLKLHDAHDPAISNPGMKEFMRVADLVDQRLVTPPEVRGERFYRVAYTEREGPIPTVQSFAHAGLEARWIADEISRLRAEERVALQDILVIRLKEPKGLADVLTAHGVPARGYGGAAPGAVKPADFKLQDVDHVRVTTIFSAKGHEAPVVFLAGLEWLEDIDWLLKGDAKADGRAAERTRRSLFYVGATRATVRQYVSGSRSRFVAVSAAYAARLNDDP